MLVFPQFVTGASALYPVLKRRQKQTVVNILDNGARDVYADEDAALVEWELHATGMTATEWNAIENLFAAGVGNVADVYVPRSDGKSVGGERDTFVGGVDATEG